MEVFAVMNLNTIQYWHKLEHFYPYILEEQRDEKIKTYNIKNVSDFPDFKSPDLPPNMEVRYYEVYLGLFKVNSALQVLADKMNVKNQFYDEDKDKYVSCFCKFRLDCSGQFDRTSFKISSFPWAIQQVFADGIHIKEWDASFHNFQKTTFLRFFDVQNIITYELLKNILHEIKNDIAWKIEFDDCWMRIDRTIGERQKYNSTKEEIEEIEEENEKIDELIKANDLLNSFYVRDIEKVTHAITQGNYGMALNNYIDHSNDIYFDVENNTFLLFQIFNPQNMPMGKWPSGYPLRAMQQVAVNVAMSENLNTENIFSVNGPPGTGKTTLLRDIIAANVVDRAIALLQLDTPNDAFTNDIGCITYKRYTNHVRELKENLNTYGILVASNNNAAVQNITMELPLLDAISEKYRNNNFYFSEVSDLLTEQETWGLCAAKLGNKKNCSAFINTFWPLRKEDSKKYNLNHYLTNVSKKSENCVSNWENAKSRFNQKYEEVKQEYNNLKNYYNLIIINTQQQKLLPKEKEKYSSLKSQKKKLQEELCHIQNKLNTLNQHIEQKEIQKKSVRDNITFFTIKYLLKHGVNDYLILEQNILKLLTEKRNLEDITIKQALEIQIVEKQIGESQKQIEKIETNITETKHLIDTLETKYNYVLPTKKYLSELTGSDEKKARQQAQSKSPWSYKKIIRLREELFL